MDESTKVEIIDFLENKAHNCNVMVIGDVMLDRYFYGNVTRISPEAPVPVNCIEKKKNVLGGAANVANNLSKLGCQVYLAGAIGNDHHGRLLTKKLKKQGIHTEGIIYGREQTTTKVRVLGGHQQMMRLDFEEVDSLSVHAIVELKDYIQTQISGNIDAIIISDYGKGVCTDELCQYAIKEANDLRIPVLVDPKGTAWQKYCGANYVTPNVKEAGVVLGKFLKNETDLLRQAAKEIKDKFNIQSVMITRSEKGVSIFGNNETTVSTVAKEVFDVSGAGDTVISAFTLAISGNLGEKTALTFANLAAGIEVGKVGTYAVSKEEIIEVL